MENLLLSSTPALHHVFGEEETTDATERKGMLFINSEMMDSDSYIMQEFVYLCKFTECTRKRGYNAGR